MGDRLFPKSRCRDDGPFGRDQGEAAETAAGAVYAACCVAASGRQEEAPPRSRFSRLRRVSSLGARSPAESRHRSPSQGRLWWPAASLYAARGQGAPGLGHAGEPRLAGLGKRDDDEGRELDGKLHASLAAVLLRQPDRHDGQRGEDEASDPKMAKHADGPNEHQRSLTAIRRGPPPPGSKSGCGIAHAVREHRPEKGACGFRKEPMRDQKPRSPDRRCSSIR